jgi:hypothetical protein
MANALSHLATHNFGTLSFFAVTNRVSEMCHCERNEAISIEIRRDCFVVGLLAMTVNVRGISATGRQKRIPLTSSRIMLP